MTSRSGSLIRRIAAPLCLLALCAPCFAASDDAGAAFAEAGQIKRGVNVLGYDGVWNGEVDAPFRMSNFKLIHDAGFDHVRLNLFGFRYMDADGKLNEQVLERLDRVIGIAISQGLTVILDQHDNRLCQEHPEKCKAPLVAFWKQIAARYAGKYPHLFYEILNEPGGEMSAAQWNEDSKAALSEIRSRDPNRPVVVAALNVDDVHTVEKLDLPPQDRNIIVTVHYYQPYRFTFQGAAWSHKFAQVHDVKWGSPEDRKQVDDDFGVIAAWANAHKRPIYLGEFGVYESAPADSRLAWTSYVARTAERLGWSWGYWQFDHDFALFDSTTHTWHRHLLDALLKGK